MDTASQIKAAQTQSEAVCQAAAAATPEQYRQFLIRIPQNKRLSGKGQSAVYATIDTLYMGVDGRVKMCIDEHMSQKARLDITTAFITEPTSGQILCKATADSSLYGTFTGHARAFMGGQGADATNPLEVAETSAVGRALGFMGYGLYGHGIASAEEVGVAQTQQESSVMEQAKAKAEEAKRLPDVPTYVSLMELASTKGFNPNQVRAWLRKEFGITSTQQLNGKQIGEAERRVASLDFTQQQLTFLRHGVEEQTIGNSYGDREEESMLLS